ncbi:ribonuclease inhibitor [Chryseobacterium sp. ERMR1:04]|uniref:ribonuclease inhibitor n=1 Tax=Chryseobacterium sp. ERMR1:04 TaxID=1705393 RepID=UPI0006C862A7|nr:ribonuclease inhibitor [Chryseobacterium sp. ERMR1:04]KPH14934.1 ribonuclease inhibitor [Chryseobacterium sp. ERMR1:04]
MKKIVSNKKVIVINGIHFSSLVGFYEEVSNVLTKDINWKVGTLDDFNDILYGGFGVFENDDEVKIIWEESEKSRQDLGFEATKEFYENKIKQGKPFNIELIQEKLNELIKGNGQTLFDILLEIIEDHKNITLILD